MEDDPKYERAAPTVKTTVLPVDVAGLPPVPEVKMEPSEVKMQLPPEPLPQPSFPPLPTCFMPQPSGLHPQDLAPVLLGTFLIGGVTAFALGYLSRRQE